MRKLNVPRPVMALTVVRPVTALIVVLVLLLGNGMAMAQDRPRVVAVNYPLQYFADRLAEEAAEVVFPVPADVDPSFWRPAIADISMIQSAEVILLNGAGFATWVDRVSLPRSRVVNTAAAVEDRFITTESITHAHGDGGEHSHEGLASYTWLDPTLAIAQAEAVAAALAARGIVEEAVISGRLDALRDDLEALDAHARTALEAARGVAIIATHPRYQYLARRYGLKITALDWEAKETPDDVQLADLSALIDKTGARVLIWEAAPADGAIAATDALDVKSVVFRPLARRPSDGTFIDVFGQGVAELAAALADGSEG